MALTKAQLRDLKRTPAPKGNRIEAAREMLELTQQDLEAKTGIRQAYISSVENGKFQTVTVDRAREFADFFGTDIETLFPASAAAAVSRG